jgi:hypothetical protein
MKNKLTPDTWIWIVVQNPGADEQFLGQHDREQQVSFLPAFFNKEDAQQCLIHMTTRKGDKYEVQAILFGELTKDAAKNGFLIFMLNADGEILEKIMPPFPAAES